MKSPAVLEARTGLSGKTMKRVWVPQPIHSEKRSFERIKEDWLKRIFSNADYTLGDKCVATAISWHLNRERRDAFPGFSKLAKEAGVCCDTVIEAIKKLRAGGDVQVMRRGGQSNLCHPNLSTGKPKPELQLVGNSDQGSRKIRLGGSRNSLTAEYRLNIP